MSKKLTEVSDLPNVTQGAYKWMQKNLTSKMIGFEWGSGGSTVYFGQKVKRLTTVEHHWKWYAHVKEALNNYGVTKCEYILIIPLGPLRTRKAKHRSSRSKGWDFIYYCKFIHHFPDDYFDFVFVDGRSRAWCIKYATRHIKPGGYMIIDNARRYGAAQRALAKLGWTCTDFFEKGLRKPNIIWSTRVWQKPDVGSPTARKERE